MRIENDKLGSMELEDSVLYGIHTKRAASNFAISTRTANPKLIAAITEIKKAAAQTNASLHLITSEQRDAICAACDQILDGQVDHAFITSAYQGGAGTSTHMNVNEVIANLGLKYMGVDPGTYDLLHPLDHVNKGQSTNDVYPTALRIASIRLIRNLSLQCSKLQESLQRRELEFAEVLKLGRTQLMDAMPITLGQEFGSYAQAISRDRWRIYKAEERLRQINLGGTAVGTGNNTSRKYTYRVIDTLRDMTGIGLSRAEYPMDLTQNNDVFVEVSGLLKALAVNLFKICTDLRLMNSGPGGGLGEISLEELQAGSTIMPGKVNPVIPEMISQTAIKVMANDMTVTTCAANGNFELNAFTPLIADSLLESLELLVHSLEIFRLKCIDTLQANRDNCRAHLDRSLTLITALAPYIGYEAASEISRACDGKADQIKEQVLKKNLLDETTLNKILSYEQAITYLA